jgi:hypothetical protein
MFEGNTADPKTLLPQARLPHAQGRRSPGAPCSQLRLPRFNLNQLKRKPDRHRFPRNFGLTRS